MPTQGSESLAKDDTHFYASAATPTYAELATDLSQYGEDWTEGAGNDVIYSTASRLNVDGSDGRCICVQIDTSGLIARSTLFARVADPTSNPNSNGLVWDGSTDFICCVAGSTVGTINAVDLHPSTSQTYQICWSTRANPDTTGSSNALVSELQVWNIDTGTFDMTQFTHAVFPSGGTHIAFFGADTTYGSNAHGDAFHAARYSIGRPHTSSEGREDWIALSTAPTLTLDDRIEQLVPASKDGLGATGMPVGPVEILCSKAVRQNKLRMVSPLVNKQFETQDWLESTWANVATEDRLADWPSTSAVALNLYACHAPVPDTVNRIRGRVFIQSDMDVTASDTGDDESHIILTSSALFPRNANDLDHDYNTDQIDFSNDHGATATGGAWYSFAEIPIARDDNGWSWFILSLWFTGTARDQRCRIKSLVIDPGLEPESGSELPHGVGD